MPSTWPEQDACEQWWQENRLSLKEAVSKPRIEIHKENEELRERVAELQSLLNEIRAFAPERPEKGRMYLVPTSKFMYIDAAFPPPKRS